MAHVSPSLQIYNEISTRNQKCGRHIITIPCRKSRRAAHSWHNQWSCSSFHQISDITTESSKDEKIKEAMKSLETNRWNKSSPFYKIKDELTTSKNTLLKSNCIVIPQTLIQKTLEIPHNQYQAISKTKAWLQEKVWWPGLSADTECYITSCYACHVTTPSRVKCEPQKWVRSPKYLGTP